jgi:pyruvate formate lyase activating enzyme
MNAIEKEMVFFDQSNGGVTFSGGEPLMHADFLIKLLDACGEKNIHRVVDTTGFSKKEILLKVAERTDHFLFDLKMMDSEKHKKYTGVENNVILENLEALALTGASINIRIPLIKGVNDDAENIDQTIRFIASLPGEKKKINILPYHGIAAKKYEKLGGKYDEGDMAEPSEEEQLLIVEKFALNGLDAVLGG